MTERRPKGRLSRFCFGRQRRAATAMGHRAKAQDTPLARIRANRLFECSSPRSFRSYSIGRSEWTRLAVDRSEVRASMESSEAHQALSREESAR
jgi:hypothetical protein